jgi:hypothetical protein
LELRANVLKPSASVLEEGSKLSKTRCNVRKCHHNTPQSHDNAAYARPRPREAGFAAGEIEGTQMIFGYQSLENCCDKSWALHAIASISACLTKTRADQTAACATDHS